MITPASTAASFALTYERYYDQVLGGWFGKSLGGVIGAAWEGYKGWIEITADEAIPAKLPANDDLDLQVLWLRVVEEFGPYFRATDLADAWLDGCWYPFNEYGVFRKNYRLGIPPPYTAQVDNAWWETGMGCPIRSEIWGYLCPGAPDLAAGMAVKDGSLDHTVQSVSAELMLAAMAADAFFIGDIRRLIAKHLRYLPQGTTIRRLSEMALAAYDQGLTLAETRQRLLLAGGNPEACDAQVNVPFTLLALLHGQGDLWETILCALRLGYDTDCTCATAGAFVGQRLGYHAVPERWKQAIGDELVMGIQYKRPEMTLSALARDTARAGLLISDTCRTGVTITDAPAVAPWPATVRPDTPAPLTVAYPGSLTVAPGEQVRVTLVADPGALGSTPVAVTLEAPEGWQVLPTASTVSAVAPRVEVVLQAPTNVDTWPMSFRFTARLAGVAESCTFALLGTPLWQLLGVFHDPFPFADTEAIRTAAPDTNPRCARCGYRLGGCTGQCMPHHYVDLAREYLTPEADPDLAACTAQMRRVLGCPPVIPGRTWRVPVEELVQLTGEYGLYLAREIISPDTQEVGLMIGHTDAIRIYLNGELVVERDAVHCWAPQNHWQGITLQPGRNRLVVKLLKRTDAFTFTLSIREKGGGAADHVINLADGVPACLRGA